MKKKTLILAAAIATGCASTPEPFNWQDHATPLPGGEYITNAQDADKQAAEKLALKTAYKACQPMRPAIIDQTITRTGLMSEKVADAYNLARITAAALGQHSPNINDEKYTAIYKFRCEKH